jgi:TRAP-type C4-dicarboxylate transport system permease small subunit
VKPSLAALLNRLAYLERTVAGIAILLLAILLLGEVFSREIFGSSLPWAQKLALHLMIYAGCLGVSLASSEGKQLRPELGDLILPKSMRPHIASLREACIAIFCLFYFYLSLSYVQQSREFGDVNVVTHIPLWVVQAILPFVFLSLGFKHSVFAFIPTLRPTKQKGH